MTVAPELLYLLAGDPAEFATVVGGMQPADMADALGALPPGAAARVVAALPFDMGVLVLDDPALENRVEIVRAMDGQTLEPLLSAMSGDRQAELFREMSEQERTRLLPALHPKAQEALQLLLRYPPESAGGIMTTEFLTVPATWTVDEALQLIRRVGGAKETVYAVYVVDPNSGALRHVVSLRELILSDRGRRVDQVGSTRKMLTVTPRTDREDVARLISKYDLLAVPVVDADGRVLGIVTVDDVIDALVAETTEDVQKFGGMAALDEPYMEISLPRMLRKRAGWLAALFIGEMLTASAMGHFEHEIERAVILALFVPLIISSGGNSGSQATSLIIRAMALGEVRLRDWWRVAVRELPSGICLGAFLGDHRVLPYPGVAGPRLVRLRAPASTGGVDRRRRAHRCCDLRIAGGIHAALRASATRFRPRQRVRALRRHSRRRHGTGHLFQHSARDAAGYAAVTARARLAVRQL